MLAVAETEHLEVIHGDRAAGGRDVAGWAVQDTIVRSGEGPLLNGDLAGDVKGVHLDMRVGEGADPAGEKLGTGRLSLAADPARRVVGDVVGEHAGEPVDVMGVKGLRALLERLAYGL